MFLARTLLILFLLFPASVWAASSCTINTSTGPAFGTYDSLGPHASSPLDATGRITIQCNGAADDLSISLDQGIYPAPGSSCALPLRQMGSGTGRLRYNLYLDAPMSSVWGCTFATSTHRTLPSGRTDNVFVIYARVPPAQDPPPGTYMDTVGILVTF